VVDDCVLMQGDYLDVITGEWMPSDFEADYELIYKLLSSGYHFANVDYALDELAKAFHHLTDEVYIDLGDYYIDMCEMIFRLTPLVKEVENGEFSDGGFYIEDAQILDRPSFSCIRHIGDSKSIHYAPSVNAFEGSCARLSGHLVLLAYRYLYFNALIEGGALHDDALYLSSLSDPVTFQAAKTALEFISLKETCNYEMRDRAAGWKPDRKATARKARRT